MNKMTFTKITSIFSTFFFAFAINTNALVVTNSNGVLTLDYSEPGDFNIENYLNDANIRVNTHTLVIKGNYQNVNAISNFSDWGIETLDLTEAVLPQYYKFRDLYKLSEIKWPAVLGADGKMKTFIIPSGCFETGSATGSLVNLTIPSNCAEVQATAFSNSVVEEVTIEGPSTILRARCFFNADKVKNVYVLSGEETYTEYGQTKYYCEKTAFDFDATWVQTQIENVSKAACLHIPEGADKNVFRVNGVDVLTEELSQSVLCNHFHESSVNGWQEFINNGVIVDQKEIFRTFSDTKPHLFRQCRDIKTGLKVYYVVGTIDVGDAKKILIEPLNEDVDYVLPANTGALIYSEKEFLIYDVPETQSNKRISQFVDEGDDYTPRHKLNYLESLQDCPDNKFLSWSSTYLNNNYVNMFLNFKRDIDETPNEWGFYTIIPKVYTKEEIEYKAYLSFPTTVMDSSSMYGFNDGSGDVPPSIKKNDGKVFDLSFDENNDVTGIFAVVKRSNSPEESDTYYNLSGQQISVPSNGLYIHNGKKYMK